MFVDNIGIVRKDGFEKNRLMLHEISVSSGSGRALSCELSVERLGTLPSAGTLWPYPQGAPMFLAAQLCRGMGTGSFDGPRYNSGPPQTGDPVALPLCLPLRSQIFSSTGTSLD